ncbi:ADP-ribosylation factor 5-like [Tubulanus polymorphus]|uniref:ADP-ribosylation factor 5-like n=1 Tax=Tubulanus polymorphus TaxID=672921 RepID=UPI003DA5470D
MGLNCSRFFKQKDIRLLFLGLDGVGKTTLLYKLKLGDVVQTIPTIGFNVESIEHNNTWLVAWDVGSRDKMRPLWRHYYQNTSAVVYLVDSQDKERLAESAELFKQLECEEDDLRDAVFLVLANKQDGDHTIPVETIRKEFDIDREDKTHEIGIFPITAIDGTGIDEALEWLVETVAKNEAKAHFHSSVRDVAIKDSYLAWQICSSINGYVGAAWKRLYKGSG